MIVDGCEMVTFQSFPFYTQPLGLGTGSFLVICTI